MYVEPKSFKIEAFMNAINVETGGEKANPNSRLIPPRGISSNMVALLEVARFFFVFPGKITHCTGAKGWSLQIQRRLYLQIVSAVLYIAFCIPILTESWSLLAANRMVWLDRMENLWEYVVWIFSNAFILIAFGRFEKIIKMLNLMDEVQIRMTKNGFKQLPELVTKHLLILIFGIIFVGIKVAGIFDTNVFNEVPINLDSVVVALRLRGRQRSVNLVVLNTTLVENLRANSSDYWMELMGGVARYTVLVFGQFIELFGNLLVITMSLSTWFLVRSLDSGLKNSELVLSEDEVLEIFNEILTLFRLVEEVMGPVVFFICFGNLAYFAADLTVIFGRPLPRQIVYFSFVILYFCATIPAAASNTMLKNVPTWFKNQALRGRKSMNFPTEARTKTDTKLAFEAIYDDRCIDLVLQEVTSKEIGIRGSVFTITFSFIGQIWSLVVTYGVLLSQMGVHEQRSAQ